MIARDCEPDLPLVSIIVVSLNGESVLPRCIDSLFALDWPADKLEIIAVNNGSSDGTREILDSYQPRGLKPIHLPSNLGFAGGNNVGIRAAGGDWVILLNDDTEAPREWVRELMHFAQVRPRAGILGSLLLYPDRKTIQHFAGVIRPNGLTQHIGNGEEDCGQYSDVRDADYVTGAAFAIRRDVIDRIGLLDPGYWPIYFEEIDYCWRARGAGFEVVATPARAIHYESRTTVVHSEGFMKKYHRNRIRFVMLNFSPARLFSAVAEEKRWLCSNRPHLPLRLLAGVYAKCALMAPCWLSKRVARKVARPSGCKSSTAFRL